MFYLQPVRMEEMYLVRTRVEFLVSEVLSREGDRVTRQSTWREIPGCHVNNIMEVIS